MRIIGIDPGLQKTGFGVIQAQGSRLTYVVSGTIVIPTKQPLATRLKHILDDVSEVIQTTNPDIAVVEKVFVNNNPSSTLLLGQARGAAICALANADLPVFEYTALQVKKSVVGNGHAAKEQIQQMVKRLLNLSDVPAPDSADALACAICHYHAHSLTSRLVKNNADIIQSSDRRLKSGRIIR